MGLAGGWQSRSSQHNRRPEPYPSHPRTMTFAYDATHRVVVCEACRSCVVPGSRSQERHLWAEPHRLLGAILRTTVQLLESYGLRSVEELREPQAAARGQVPGDQTPRQLPRRLLPASRVHVLLPPPPGDKEARLLRPQPSGKGPQEGRAVGVVHATDLLYGEGPNRLLCRGGRQS